MPTIVDIRTSWLRVPFPTPIADSTHQLRFMDLIVVEVEDQEAIGNCYMLSFDYAPSLLKAFVDVELKRYAIGQPSDNIGAIHDRLLQACEYIGQSGLAMWGIAAIDTALWDLLGRRLKIPASTLFGRHSDAVPAYGSGGWISYTEKELADEVGGYLARGLRAVKIKIGGPSEDWDVARVQAVRQAIGADVALRVDANQGLTVHRALRTLRRLENCNLSWLEEPLHHNDVVGYVRLSNSTEVPIAAGEREYGVEPFRRLIGARALGIVQPDLLRVGGVTGWRNVAVLTEANCLQLAPHFYKEYDVHLSACYRNSLGIECFDWLDPLLAEPLELRDGMIVVPQRPGFGVNFRPDAMAEYAMSS